MKMAVGLLKKMEIRTSILHVAVEASFEARAMNHFPL